MSERQPFGSKLWSERELTIMKRNYAAEGTAGVMKRLQDEGFHRTRSAVNCKAHDLMLVVGELEGYVSASKVAGHSGNAEYFRVLFLACRDGALKVLPAARTRYVVPIEWADKFFAERDKKREKP